MPKRVRYTREEIAETAFSIVRERGEEALSARNLARELGVSTAPVFTAFGSIDEVMGEVICRAWQMYESYIDEGLKMTPPFKGTGLMYIKFAKDEPKLFKLLFMKGTRVTTHYFPEGDSNEPLIRGAVEGSYGLDSDEAKRIYNHLSVYVHGLAVMFAEGSRVYTDEDVSRMLSEVFSALTGLPGESLDTRAN